MRIRRAHPSLLLLLITPALGAAVAAVAPAAQSPEPANELLADNILAAPQKVVKDSIDTTTTTAARSQQTIRYKGTEDAPVDGLDGKPHDGPFVDTTPEEAETTKKGKVAATTTTTAKSRPTSLEKFAEGTGDDKWRLEDIPEKNDGVMNDANRTPPKKGTTGTEGGITEKQKERKSKPDQENKPQVPKEAPPLPHSEQMEIDAEQERLAGEKPTPKVPSKEEDKTTEPKRKVGGEYGAGGYGMEKPSDLPEKPHNIPHSDPKSANAPPVVDSEETWLKQTMPYTEGQTNPKTPSTGKSGVSSASGDESWHEWFHSFVLSLTMILFSEVGDKTFLIAALMAMRHPRILVFSAALGALVVMTILSAVLGHAVPTLLPKRFTTFAAAMLFLVFGARMLREGLAMPRDSGVGEEMKEVEAELEEKEHNMALDRSHRRVSTSPYSLESGRGRTGSKSKQDFPAGEPSPPSSRSPSRPRSGADRLAGLMNLCSLVLSPAWVQTFVMTFLGEWGDRSQIATIAMAAGQDYWWVTLGAVTGHAVCTGLAVLGGRALAGKVSMRVVTIGGAVAFLIFGVIYLFECITDS